MVGFRGRLGSSSVGLVGLVGFRGRLGSSSAGLVGLRLEEARWSGKMRKSPGQDDLHGEEEMDEQCQLNFICNIDKTVDLQVKKEETWTLFGECSPSLHMTCIFELQSRLLARCRFP